ncbi:hypothetical protein CF328_g9016, partial [Tilletia controversa]
MADASEAFRAVGAAKDQWPGLVILAPSGWFIIDTRLPFGLASATGVWGSVADATLVIIHAHFDTEVGLRAVKWVDDFVFMKPPSSDLLLNDVLAVTEPLGFPWHPEKRSEFENEIRYLGFEFNVHTFVVMLPEDKAAKYRERHIIIMARDLGPHLADFAEFLGVFDREDLFQHRFIPARVQDEAKVWLKALGSPLRRSFAAPGPPFPHDIFVDASTEWGIGITSGERWAAYKFRPGWQQESRQILWAEAVALEFGLLVAIEMGGAGHSILIHSDNQGVIGAFRFGRCRGRQANTVLKRIVNLERAHKFELRIKYPPSNRSSMTYGGLNQVLSEHRAVDKRRRASSSVAGAPISTRPPAPTPFFPPSIRGATDELPSHVAICEERFITAANRIFRWAPSPGPASSLSTTSGFDFDPSGLMRGSVNEVLEFSLEESTCTSYSTGIIKFNSFCDSAGIPIQDRCP